MISNDQPASVANSVVLSLLLLLAAAPAHAQEDGFNDCVVELIWQACLTYDIESFHVRRLAEDELHLPYLKITTDYAPSDSARITARVEALSETVRARRNKGP